MKRILALLLCLAMALSVTACKPDNIKYPVEITDPTLQEEENNTPEPKQETGNQPEQDEAAPEAEEEPAKQDEPASETEEEQPAEEVKDEEDPVEEQPETEEPETPQNPLAAAGFVPSVETAGTLQLSGIIQPGDAVSPLKNHTITLYTADDQTAFTYLDKNGKTVSEWDWMEKLADENGFLLKRQVKSNAVSLKAQRVALFSGQKLSLVQMLASELGNGMTLATSAEKLMNKEAVSFGISKAVLEQSDYKLFAPIGNVASLWYDPSSLPETADLQTLNTEKKWTVEQFKTLCGESRAAQRLDMADPLPWATLSGRSPLTLLNGKLDSNLHAGVTREVWTAVKDLDLNGLNLPREGTETPDTLFTYTDAPTPAEGKTLQYLPLPSLKEETAGTVTFTGTFLALPKYEEDQETLRAALTFAELWCNRYTEVRAGVLQALGIKGTDYQTYCDMAETQGVLILDAPEIREAAETYLAGLTDPAIDMNSAYEEIRNRINGLLAARNLYY